ncbi:MAG: hypothetical protein K8T10_16025 [Candidatus Eremiobacteraeota bacterium]|nr:hypothetical protein [Candidatus Eremiobacteraeota bacterium]
MASIAHISHSRGKAPAFKVFIVGVIAIGLLLFLGFKLTGRGSSYGKGQIPTNVVFEAVNLPPPDSNVSTNSPSRQTPTAIPKQPHITPKSIPSGRAMTPQNNKNAAIVNTPSKKHHERKPPTRIQRHIAPILRHRPIHTQIEKRPTNAKSTPSDKRPVKPISPTRAGASEKEPEEKSPPRKDPGVPIVPDAKPIPLEDPGVPVTPEAKPQTPEIPAKDG